MMEGERNGGMREEGGVRGRERRERERQPCEEVKLTKWERGRKMETGENAD